MYVYAFNFFEYVLQVDHSPQGDKQYVVTSVDNLGEVERWRPSAMSLSLNLSSLTSSTLSSLSTGRSPSIASIETPGCEEDTGRGYICCMLCLCLHIALMLLEEAAFPLRGGCRITLCYCVLLSSFLL